MIIVLSVIGAFIILLGMFALVVRAEKKERRQMTPAEEAQFDTMDIISHNLLDHEPGKLQKLTSGKGWVTL